MYVNMHGSPEDVPTKVLPSVEKRIFFFWMLQHHIFGTCAYVSPPSEDSLTIELDVDTMFHEVYIATGITQCGYCQ